MYTVKIFSLGQSQITEGPLYCKSYIFKLDRGVRILLFLIIIIIIIVASYRALRYEAYGASRAKFVQIQKKVRTKGFDPYTV